MTDRLFAVIGEDGRQAAAARALARAGCQVGGIGQIARADYILLPMPLDDQMAGLLRAARPGAVALAGRPSERAARIAADAGVELVDYYARPELVIRNAIPTAEGCIGILLEKRPRTLWGARVGVTGYGPVGQALAPRLTALGAHVTVAARRASQRALAQSQGAGAVPLSGLRQAAAGFDILVNTVPAPVVGQQVLEALPPDSLTVDLASAPGGVDLGAAAALGRRAMTAPGLPARCAPDSAGEYVAQTVLEILREREVAE